VTVRRVEQLTPRLRRVTFGGEELEGLVVEEPAASVRLLVPPAGSSELVLPEWDRNVFLLPDGSRAPIRTFTPRRVDPDGLELDLEIVMHGSGVASEWAESASPGAPAAVSGPARGYRIDADAPAFLLAGDETAIPAISQLLDVLPAGTPTHVQIEVADAAARPALPTREHLTVEWPEPTAGAPPGDAFADAVRNAELVPGARVWAAGEAAAVQRVRKHLFEERGLSRSDTTVRGYWKHGRAAADDD
jgi:NADPH-dependent ferric siderophore reductase